MRPEPPGALRSCADDRLDDADEHGAATPAATRDRIAGWRSDLAQLVPGMDRLHPDLGHGTPVSELQAAVDDLTARVPDLTDDQLLVGVMHVVALVSAHGCDAHTGAFVWGTGTYPVESLPLRVWLFGDDVVIVDTLPPYERLVGLRIDAIDDQPIADVLAALDPIIPRDNDQTVRLLTPRYLLIPQVLHGLGLAGDGAVSLGLEAGDGDRTTEDVEPIPMADYNAWAGPYGLHLPADPSVEYLSRIDDALWWQMQPDGETLFVQYNRVDHLPLGTTAGLRTALHGPGVARIVLDLRHNYGGEVSALVPILAMFVDPAVNQPGRLYVITGRNTFSAASQLVAQLDAQTDATLVGEPMGGCPTAYGNPSDLTLPFSGIVVSVSGMLEVGVSADDTRPTIEPDIPAILSRDEWADGSDPALGIVTTVVP
jgi:hypothetical protein